MNTIWVSRAKGGLVLCLMVSMVVTCSKSEPTGEQATAAGGAVKAGGTTLVINADTSDPAPKAAMEQLIADFEAAHPEIDVELNLSDHEAFKTTVRNFLSTENAPDIISWYAGNRMKAFVDLGLLDDVSDVWADQKLVESMASAMPSMTVKGKQYGVPYTSYQWGIYYRKDLFEKHGLTAPTTWDELLGTCKALRAEGIAPFAIGTKFLWTAAGWFDYLDLRVNGLDFHMELMEGKVSYTDDRVKAVFDTWKQLLDADCFLENHATYSWQEAQPFLNQGKAAMYLIGNFLIGNLPAETVAKMAFLPFPEIDPAVGRYEDAPIDSLHIPAKAKNKAAARAFLAFLATPEQQSKMNAGLGQLPIHKDATLKDDRFLEAGAELVRSADGLAQFYDRDTSPEMAKIGMEGFQEFMIKPERRDAILERLEKARQRIFR